MLMVRADFVLTVGITKKELNKGHLLSKNAYG